MNRVVCAANDRGEGVVRRNFGAAGAAHNFPHLNCKRALSAAAAAAAVAIAAGPHPGAPAAEGVSRAGKSGAQGGAQGGAKEAAKG